MAPAKKSPAKKAPAKKKASAKAPAKKAPTKRPKPDTTEAPDERSALPPFLSPPTRENDSDPIEPDPTLHNPGEADPAATYEHGNG